MPNEMALADTNRAGISRGALPHKQYRYFHSHPPDFLLFRSLSQLKHRETLLNLPFKAHIMQPFIFHPLKERKSYLK